MAKPIIVFEFKGIPTQEDKQYIKEQIDKMPLIKEYYTLCIFDCDKTNVKLLVKGRNTKTITKKFETLLKLSNNAPNKNI